MTKRNLGLLVLGLLVAALFVLVQVLFIVHRGEAVVLTTFGRADEQAITDPGLYVRWPWPVQRVYRFDARTQTLDGAFEQTLTRDGKNVIVTLYAGWRIADSVLFLRRANNVEQAERSLNGLLSNYKNAVLGRYPFAALVNVDPTALKFEEIEQAILTAVQPEALARYGIAVDFLGIHKLSLPESITEKVFERMRAEREEVAERYRSEGEGEAIRLRGEADSLREQRLAEAEGNARRIRAEGDAQAVQYYEVFARDPELAMFLRKTEVLEQVLGEKSTVILSSETEPFDLLGRPKDLDLPAAPSKP